MNHFASKSVCVCSLVLLAAINSAQGETIGGLPTTLSITPPAATQGPEQSFGLDGGGFVDHCSLTAAVSQGDTDTLLVALRFTTSGAAPVVSALAAGGLRVVSVDGARRK